MTLALLAPLCAAQNTGNIIYAKADKKLNTGETPDLMSYDLVTGQHRLLMKGTVSRRGEANASVSPKGDQIIFGTYRYRGWKLAIADYNAGEITNIRRFTKRPNYEYGPQWSHDGKKVVYVEYNWGTDRLDFFIWDKASDKVEPLNQTERGGFTPQWTFDDQRIIFSSKSGSAYDIFSVDLKKDKAINLTNHSSHDMAPSCSPLANQVAFLSNREGKLDLYIMNQDGAGIQNLTKHLNTDKFTFTDWQDSASWAYKTSWSPDGSQIVFTAPIKGNLHLFIINADGSGLRQITDSGAANFSAHWTR